MNKKLILVISIALYVGSCNEKANIENRLTPDEQNSGWQLLFDGKTTEGWRGFQSQHIPEGWKAENSALTTTGAGDDMGGDIISEFMYEDFELSLDWSIAEGGNSGIMFHVLENNYPSTYATGPEYQLIDDIGFPQKLEDWQKTGANYAMHTADSSHKILNSPGQFNSTRIKVKDGHVVHWLNENKIVEYNLWTTEWFTKVENSKWKDYPGYGRARKGYIALQDHGSQVSFKNIKVKDLTDTGTPLFNGENLDGWVVHGNGDWYVQDKTLIGANPEGGEYSYLVTEKEYKDFLLRLDFKFEGYGNSGVFFRSDIEGVDIIGWQAEVAPPGEDSGGIYESGGRGWLFQIPDEKESILIADDWNNMVIRVIGNQVITWLNNEMMACFEDEKVGNGDGIIALQLHSGTTVKVYWKNIFIKEF